MVNPATPDTLPTAPPLRAALLRDLGHDAQGIHAVVSMGPGQCLLVPLPGAVWPWEQRIGRRVWVDVSCHPMRLCPDTPAHRPH